MFTIAIESSTAKFFSMECQLHIFNIVWPFSIYLKQAYIDGHFYIGVGIK